MTLPMLELIIRDGGLIDAPGRRPYLGLARRMPPDTPAPAIFWRYYSDQWHRRDGIVAPWWLVLVLVVRDRWQRWLFLDLLERLGLWEIVEEGGYIIRDGRPTLPRWVRRAWWCFLRDRDEPKPYRIGPMRCMHFRVLIECDDPKCRAMLEQFTLL